MQSLRRRAQGQASDRHDHLVGIEERRQRLYSGEILDPDSGAIYRAKAKLLDGGNKLEVRGYIGVSLFGRSQTWIRQQ